jgi:hypothetical protein
MEKIMEALERFSIVPVDFDTLESVFWNYKSPKDKIATLEKNGELIRLKKGLFVVSPKSKPLSKELIANHLYGPSYVSLESALSFYKFIPERVHTVRSMTLKRSRTFSTPVGNFEYIGTQQDYYKTGIRQEIDKNNYAFLIASPEKAICDMIIATPRLRIQSPKAMQTYLEEDLRIESSLIDSLQQDIITQCVEAGKKKTELVQLLKILQK